MKKTNWQISPLHFTKHDRETFNCGEKTLDDFIQKYVQRNTEELYGKTYVATEGNSFVVCGYYTLSSSSIYTPSVPSSSDLPKRIPRFPMPAALIARLAVNNDSKGLGLGSFLLMDVFSNILNNVVPSLGCVAFVVDAINDEATKFYKKFGFIQLKDKPNSLMIPVATIKKLGL